jgi:predicted transcriptional regulator
MRILIDLPDATVEKLTSISTRRRLPRAAVMREALDRFLRDEDAARQASDAAFGSWGDGEDGLAFQQRIRSEW